MAICPLTTGFDYDCDDNAGGIEQGSILITQLRNIESKTITSGEVTALTQATGTSFFNYKIRKNIAGAVTTETHDPKIGIDFYETVLSFTMNKLSKEKNTEFKLLAGEPLVIIYKDMNQVYHVIGLDNGAEKMGGTNGSQTGVEMAEQNGYQLAFTDQSRNYPYTVDPTVVSGLDIVVTP